MEFLQLSRLLHTVCRYDEKLMYVSFSVSSLRNVGRAKNGGTI